MSHNTHVTSADKLWLLPSDSTHYCHTYTTPEIPGTQFHTRTLLLSSSDPVLLFIVYYCLISCYFSNLCISLCSDPVLSCASHSCIHCIAVFPLALPIYLTSSYVSDS